MSFLNKLQALPEKKKKIILWSIMIIMAIFFLWLYIQNVQERMKHIEGKGLREALQVHELEEELKNLPW